MRRHALSGAVVAVITVAAGEAAAHAFGQRYDLPVPLELWVAGGAAAVAFSFLVIGLFVRTHPGRGAYPRFNLLRSPVGRALAYPALVSSIQVIGVGIFVLVVVSGLVGHQNPVQNFTPTLVWIVWWVGLAYVSALAGDLWALLNPWRATFGWAEAIYRRFTGGDELSWRLPYPTRLGVWPAVVLFWMFAWVELVLERSAVPAFLAVMAVAYAALMWGGMLLYGRDRWLGNGDAFTVTFGLLARLAPSEVRVVNPKICSECDLQCRDADGACINCYACFARAEPAEREWNLRPYAVGLLRSAPASASLTAFVLLLLSTVTFDGFKATPAWEALATVLYVALPDLAGVRVAAVDTLGLIGAPVLFFAVYLAFGRTMAMAAGRRRTGADLARAFVFTLIPIASAYHLAHYLSYLLIQGQRVVPLLSDPFGWGWNLLGTAGYQIDIGIVGARFAWYTAVAAIVAGHIVAVYLAHVRAFHTFGARGPALRSQYPMLLLMVGYTTVSLWIIAQPIVEP